MDINIFFNDNEKPLDKMVKNGGMARIFRTIACVGDSLSSGEFESHDEKGNVGYHDMYEFSWGQFISREMGSKVYNFSRGGMTAKEYIKEFAEANDMWNPQKKSQAYILALGVNDIICQNHELGTIDDIKTNWQDNGKTFAGYYGAIIQRYKAIQPEAKFFLMTMVREDIDWVDEKVEMHADLLCKMADCFDNTYVLDLRKYAPVYNEEFKKKFYMFGHLNPMGYCLTGDMVMSYIDYIIRHNMDDFKEIGYIGTDIKNVMR